MLTMADSNEPIRQVFLDFDIYYDNSLKFTSFNLFYRKLQLKQLFIQHQKKIKQLVFYQKVWIYLKNFIFHQMKN
jgi:hypothetical protein